MAGPDGTNMGQVTTRQKGRFFEAIAPFRQAFIGTDAVENAIGVWCKGQVASICSSFLSKLENGWGDVMLFQIECECKALPWSG